jgi:tetratricopeptide (TPR) repeat protein
MPDDSEMLESGVRAERAGLLDRALECYCTVAASSTNPDIVAAALTHEADVHRSRCEWDASMRAARKGQEVARRANLQNHLAHALIAEVNVLMSQGDFGEATLILHEVVSSTNDARVRGIGQQNLGIILAQTGQLRAAERAFMESRANFHEAGYVRGEAIALNNFGELALKNGEPARAQPLLEDALRLGREIQDLEVAAVASLNLASALCCNGELDRAQDLAMAALGYFAGCKNAFREIECLRLIGDINDKCDDAANARRCYDLALRVAGEIGAEAEVITMTQKLQELMPRLSGSQPDAPGIIS